MNFLHRCTRSKEKQSQADTTSVLERKHGKKHRMPASIRSVRWWSLLTNVIGEDLCLFLMIYAKQESVSIPNRRWLDIVIQCKFSIHPSLPKLSTINYLFSDAILHESDQWRQWINYSLAVSMGIWIFQKHFFLLLRKKDELSQSRSFLGLSLTSKVYSKTMEIHAWKKIPPTIDTEDTRWFTQKEKYIHSH